MRDSLAILERLQKQGCEIVPLSERIDSTGASGKLLTSLLLMLQEFEVLQLRERVSYCMTHLRKSGKRISRFSPYGYDLAENGEDLTENPFERSVIERIKGLRASGHTLWQIAGALGHDGIRSKQSASFTATSIRNILVREAKLAA